MADETQSLEAERRTVLWGATGHAKVLRESLAISGFEVTALFDNNPNVPLPWPDACVWQGEAGFRDWLRGIRDAVWCLVAVGGHRGADRRRLQSLMVQSGLKPLIWVDPRANVAQDARLSAGSQVLMGACVGAEVRLGEAVIVNTRASVDHECELADGVHIAPGAVLCGLVRVGTDTMIGAGAVVLPRKTIGRGSIVGAGSVVTRDIPDGVVAYGNPARVVRRLPPDSEPRA
ncbi:MAG: acetyltransferase [Gemmataceae bacterium]|nr:acetyltransferase [Gemmataceae bacterium]